jgi:ubiquinone/menaquinone biosynthesis C-methylase UbiE
MSGINYRFWSNYIYQICRKYCNPQKSTAIELAAGNGNLSKHLSKKFDDYLASDNSISMLKSFKVRKVNRVCFDMIYPSVNKKFVHLIVSITFYRNKN